MALYAFDGTWNSDKPGRHSTTRTSCGSGRAYFERVFLSRGRGHTVRTVRAGDRRYRRGGWSHARSRRPATTCTRTWLRAIPTSTSSGSAAGRLWRSTSSIASASSMDIRRSGSSDCGTAFRRLASPPSISTRHGSWICPTTSPSAITRSRSTSGDTPSTSIASTRASKTPRPRAGCSKSGFAACTRTSAAATTTLSSRASRSTGCCRKRSRASCRSTRPRSPKTLRG